MSDDYEADALTTREMRRRHEGTPQLSNRPRPKVWTRDQRWKK